MTLESQESAGVPPSPSQQDEILLTLIITIGGSRVSTPESLPSWVVLCFPKKKHTNYFS